MKAAYLMGYGGQEVMNCGELPEPFPKENEILVAVHAASVNPIELAIRAGKYQQLMPLTFPHVPGFDISGVVVWAPHGSRFGAGDEIYARLPGHKQGAYAEHIVVAESLLAHKPRSLSHIEAASLPTVALTTWQAFFERAHLKRDERILIHAGAGGIGSFAIQLAKYVGAHVTATAGTTNQTFLQELGVDQAIDYTQTRFEDFGPYDVVYDGVCGDIVERSINSLSPGGRYIGLVMVSDARAFMSIGLSESIAKVAAAGIAPFEALSASRQVEFHGPLTRPDAAQLSEIAALVDAGVLKPVVTQVYPLSGLPAAYESIASGRTRGKIVIDVTKHA
ncbi:NADP-dependent oxidoreductase [Aeromonas caviae]|uniref:NADP-dependent oxidoreductase n=1 Tax=Aeromonas caviae TaxID=648 RepID=UPI002B4739DF|nr:NADP-dependent oxidoreductase [Aeromonas caviae]